MYALRFSVLESYHSLFELFVRRPPFVYVNINRALNDGKVVVLWSSHLPNINEDGRHTYIIQT